MASKRSEARDLILDRIIAMVENVDIDDVEKLAVIFECVTRNDDKSEPSRYDPAATVAT